MAEKVKARSEAALEVDSEEPQERMDQKAHSFGERKEKKRMREEIEEAATMAGRGVTMEDVEAFIDEAREKAATEEGSSAVWRQGGSHEKVEIRAHGTEGSQQNVQADSQKFHYKIQQLVESLVKSAAGVLKVWSLGPMVVDALNILENPSCRPRSTAGKGDLFPLPVKHPDHCAGPESKFLQATLASLNSLHSFGESRLDRRVSPAARRVCKRLERIVKGAAVLVEPLPDINFTSFFKTKGLDYSGEEVRLALPIRWKSVESSLPPEVGCLDIRDFCYGGVAHFVNNIEETVIPVEDQVRLKPPSVMIHGDGWDEIAHGLVRRGLCDLVAEESIYKINGEILLNGLFSVSKDEV
jgi:hypothetical protein